MGYATHGLPDASGKYATFGLPYPVPASDRQDDEKRFDDLAEPMERRPDAGGVRMTGRRPGAIVFAFAETVQEWH